jgi:hypothetical protein
MDSRGAASRREGTFEPLESLWIRAKRAIGILLTAKNERKKDRSSYSAPFEARKLESFKPSRMRVKKRKILIASRLLLLGALVLASGCASKQQATEKIRPGSRIPEYRQVTVGAEKAVEAALASLTAVSAQTNQFPPEVLTSFAVQVRRLQVESVQVRARTEAMQARGDEYFNDWQKHLAEVEDPQMRALVEKERPALQQSFEKIKALSREGREAFQPFIASLRQVRNALEKNTDSVATQPVQTSIQTAREKGGEVRDRLIGTQKELDHMSALLTPPKKANSTGREG